MYHSQSRIAKIALSVACRYFQSTRDKHDIINKPLYSVLASSPSVKYVYSF